MPRRKRLQAIAAAFAGTGLVVLGAVAMARGHAVPGTALIAGTLVMTALAFHTFWVRCDFSGTSVRSGSRKGRQVALTFDDGPGPDTPAVLDALDAARVRATFFVLGQAAEARPDMVREMARRGHLVGLHGHSHLKLHLALPGTIAAEVDRGRAAIRAAGVEPAAFFRAPHGFKGPLLNRELRQRGITLVGWTRGVWDTERPGAATIVERACERMMGGEILLLHDGCGTTSIDPRRDQTAAAVPEIARRWREAGYEFVTIDRLDHVSSGAAVLSGLGVRAAGARAVRRAGRAVPGTAATAKKNTATPDVIAGKSLPAGATPPGVSGKLRASLRWLGIAALLVFSVLAARKLDPGEIQRAFAEASPSFLVAAAAANLLALIMQTGRWLAIVHPVAPRAKARDAFFSLVAGYAIGLVVPARASDLARAHLMSRRSGASMATLTATAVVDHLLGSVALFGALGLFAAISSMPLWLRSAGTIACTAAVGALLGLWLLRPREGQSVPPAADAMPSTGIWGVISRLRQGLVAVGRPRALAISWLFALGGWSSEMLIAHLSLRAFGLPAGVEASLLAVLATTLAAAASFSPANAGAFEIACVVALSGFGVAREPALAFAIGYHAVHLIPTAIIGGGWLLGHGYKATVLREVP